MTLLSLSPHALMLALSLTTFSKPNRAIAHRQHKHVPISHLVYNLIAVITATAMVAATATAITTATFTLVLTLTLATTPTYLTLA